jgi:predicted heme/steroid binding protein/uncharacterized membrane protein
MDARDPFPWKREVISLGASVKKDELKAYNGKDGRPAYVVYKGRIYDVTRSGHWEDGFHMGRHRAGEDLSDFLSMAPHETEVFERVELVGNIEEGPGERAVDRKEALRRFYRKFHPHPIFIHFPIALFAFSALMQFIFLLTENSSFENAACYAIIIASLGIVPAMASGMFSWWINYDLTLTAIFKNKLTFSIILLSSAAFLVAARLYMPDIASRSNLLSYVYNALIFLNVPVTLFIAYNGGKITWPS